MIDLKPFRNYGGYSLVVNTGTGYQEVLLENIFSYWDALEIFREHSRYIALLRNGHVLIWKKGYLSED